MSDSPNARSQPIDEQLENASSRGLAGPEKRQVLLLAGSDASRPLAAGIAKQLKMPLGNMDVGRFSDGEIRIKIHDNVRNVDAFVVQSTCPPVNEHLMELLLVVRTLKRSNVRSITAVLPYFGYARQDRKMEARVPISASDIALFLEAAGVTRVVSVDVHCGQIQGFFHNTPVDNLSAMVELVPHVCNKIQLDEKICIVSPDAGGVARAKEFMDFLNAYDINSELAITIKHRVQAGQVGDMNVVGNIVGKHCIIVDDMCDTAGTLCKSADTLIELGASKVTACITHPVFSGPALQRIGASKLANVFVADTIPLSPQAPEKIVQVSVSRLLAAAISCICEGTSVSSLFKLRRVGSQSDLKKLSEQSS